MADPISLASGVLALTTFTIQSTKTLYEVVVSFRNNGRSIRELKQELEALETVLQSLQNIQSDEQIDLSVLKLPLLRCGQACREFADVIEKCTARSSGNKASFRDWVALTYRGKDIAGFRAVIGAYKSTIVIALADTNIRYTMVTAQLLREYKEMISNTTSDLQEILEQADNELDQSSASEETPSFTGVSNPNRSFIEEEKANIEYCLDVCRRVANHLEQVQTEVSENATTRDAGNDPSPPQTRPSQARFVTSEKLSDCRTGIRFTISELQLHLQDANHRLQRLLHPASSSTGVGEEDVSRSPQTQEDLETIRQCLSICEGATEQLTGDRINVFEDVQMADDGHQIIVATLGDLISGKKISAGARSRQWLGQMSDASLQQLSKDNIWNGKTAATGAVANKFEGNDMPDNITADKSADNRVYRFEGRHGTGRTLK